MNAFDPPHKIGKNQLARMVNCAIREQMPATRYGVRVIPLSGEQEEAISAGNIQGSIFFNPAKGQGGIIFGPDNPSLATAATGRKFTVKIKGQRGNTVATVTEIATGLFTNAQLHLVWLSAWEDYLIAQDGNSNCILFNATDGTARFSLGYNTVTKERSEIPNGGTVLAYAHGRGVAVVNSRFVFASNGLNEVSLTTSIDLTKFTEQAYWATGQYFVPPSAMGGINAAAILPQRNTMHGHGDLMVHCEDGIFSIDLNVYPRSSWSSTPMVKHALLDCGAVGPYALDIQDGDQIFRSRKGIQTLRSSAAESQLEGNPNQSFSHEVNTWLHGDYTRWLRFASLCLWDTGRRFLCTTSPIVQGRYRWHRGLVVRNVDPNETQLYTAPSWEGLWTLPPEIGGIVQLVNGIFDGQERLFAWCRGVDGRNRLVEFTTDLLEDVLEDGTHRAIRCQAITRMIDAGAWWTQREFVSAKLFLRNIVGKVRWGVWVRSNKNPTWVPFRSGTAEVAVMGEGCDLTQGEPRSLPIPLGDIPKACLGDEQGGSVNEASGLQFLIRWEGSVQIEGIKLKHNANDLANDDPISSRFKVVFKKVGDGQFDDYEYLDFRESQHFTDFPACT